MLVDKSAQYPPILSVRSWTMLLFHWINDHDIFMNEIVTETLIFLYFFTSFCKIYDFSLEKTEKTKKNIMKLLCNIYK